jgi:hypothetical protein
VVELASRADRGDLCHQVRFPHRAANQLRSFSIEPARIRARQRKCSCGGVLPTDRRAGGCRRSGETAGGGAGGRQKRRRNSHTAGEGAPRCVSCVAFRPAVDHRNDVGSARSRARRVPLLACYAAVPADRIVRRRTPCRRPEIPSKLTQSRRPDQFGFPSQYLPGHPTKSSDVTLV